MYGAIKTPTDFEEYVSLNQLQDLDEPENIGYFHKACNIAGCVLVFTSFYVIGFYLMYYKFLK